MKELHVGISVRTLERELEEPGHPELSKIKWLVNQVSGHWTELYNPEKGRIVHEIVRVIRQGGNQFVWDQPVIVENPGIVMAPYRRIVSGKGEKEDKVLTYVISVERPVVECRLNTTARKSGLVLSSIQVSERSITSIEFPRGIGENRNTRFSILDTSNQERVYLLGEQNAFDAAGGWEELQDEVPELMIMPGMQPILVGAVNTNTSITRTNQGEYIIPVHPDVKRTEEKVQGTVAQEVELIKGIFPLRFPQEVDIVLDRTEQIMQVGFWDSRTPVLVDGFTKSLLSQLARLQRQNRLPITG